MDIFKGVASLKWKYFKWPNDLSFQAISQVEICTFHLRLASGGPWMVLLFLSMHRRYVALLSRTLPACAKFNGCLGRKYGRSSNGLALQFLIKWNLVFVYSKINERQQTAGCVHIDMFYTVSFSFVFHSSYCWKILINWLEFKMHIGEKKKRNGKKKCSWIYRLTNKTPDNNIEKELKKGKWD